MEMRGTQIREEEERCLQVRHVRRMRDLEEATFKGQADNIEVLASTSCKENERPR